MLECPKCSFNNELGRIFCHQCGSKLDLDKIKPPSKATRVRRRVTRGAFHALRVAIELTLAGALLLGIVLMCLVPNIRIVEPTNAELIAADTKRMDLDRLVSGHRAGTLEVTEAELNTFLHSLSFEKPKPSGLQVVPVTLRADFADAAVTITFLGEVRFNQLTKQFALAMTGTPTMTPRGFELKPTGGRIGSLPLPAQLLDKTDLVQKCFGKLFSHLGVERQALDKLSSVTIARDRALLHYEPDAK